MVNKVLLITFLAFLLVAPMIVSLESTLPISLNNNIGYTFDDKVEFIRENIKTDIDSTYKFYNSNLLLFKGSLKQTSTLKKNTESCSDNCEFIQEISINVDKQLIEDFKTERIIYEEDGITEKKRFEEPIENIEFYIKVEDSFKDVDDYEIQCTYDKEYKEYCKSVLVGSHSELVENWIPYNFEILKAGNYTLKALGAKRADFIYDWKVKINNEWTDEWSIWGNTTSVSTDGLEAYYSFDGVGVGSYGTTGGSTNFTTGKVGLNATSTYGVTNYYDSATTVDFTGQTTATFIFWFKGTGQAAYMMGCGKVGGDQGFSIRNDATNRIQAWTINNQNNYAFINPASLYDGNWHHVAVVWDISQATASDRVKFYIDGSLDTTGYSSGWNSQTAIATQSEFNIGSNYLDADTYEAEFDEVGVFNRTLNATEISDLYNSGTGLQYPFQSTGSSVELSYPVDNYNSNSTEQVFNGTITIAGGSTVENASLYINGILNKTNILTGTTNFTSFNLTLNDGTYNWTIEGCDSDGVCGSTSNRTISIDTIAPIINITSPVTSYNYLYNSQVIDLNWTINNGNGSCWYLYNLTRIDLNCTDNFTQFNYITGINNLTFYANDSFGNNNYIQQNWTVKVIENERTFNSTAYETGYESYSINVTANSSLTGITLNLNGTNYATTQNGNIWSYSLDIPTSKVGNNTINWAFTYAGDSFNSYSSYQNILNTFFVSCNSSHNNTLLNITFKDEATLGYINASILTSTFQYYLGSGSVKKSYSYVNTTEQSEYVFCAIPNQTLNVEPYVQYKQGTDYPQRIWDSDVIQYNSTITEQILYLLSSIDGIYVTFQVIDSAEQAISGVSVMGTREISGSNITVANGITGAGGGVTFWLNPDFVHYFNFSKSGYTDYVTSLTPTQTTYTITLGGTEPLIPDYTTGISISITPTGNFIVKNSQQNFGYSISSSLLTLDGYGFTLLADDAEVDSESGSNPSGETLDFTYNVSTASQMIMNYYYIVNSTYINRTSIWNLYATNEFSLSNLFTNTVSAIDTDILGVQSDDEGYFFKALLSVLILIVVAGVVSSRYGIASEQAVSGIIFGLLLLLNSINLIPSPSNFPTSAHPINLGGFIIFITALWLVVSIFKEEMR